MAQSYGPVIGWKSSCQKVISMDNGNGTILPGTNVINFGDIFDQRVRRKIGVVLLNTQLVYAKIMYLKIDFQVKRQFCRKSPKIVIITLTPVTSASSRLLFPTKMLFLHS
jgi:hypothetical protein